MVQTNLSTYEREVLSILRQLQAASDKGDDDGGTSAGAATEATLEQVRSRLPYSNTGDTTAIAASTDSDIILVTNPARKGATFYNDSTATLYLKLGTEAAANSFTTKLLQDDYYELPAGYVGVVSGVWSEANGSVYITELS